MLQGDMVGCFIENKAFSTPPCEKASLGTPLKESIKGGEGVGSVATST